MGNKPKWWTWSLASGLLAVGASAILFNSRNELANHFLYFFVLPWITPVWLISDPANAVLGNSGPFIIAFLFYFGLVWLIYWIRQTLLSNPNRWWFRYSFQLVALTIIACWTLVSITAIASGNGYLALAMVSMSGPGANLMILLGCTIYIIYKRQHDLSLDWMWIFVIIPASILSMLVTLIAFFMIDHRSH